MENVLKTRVVQTGHIFIDKLVCDLDVAKGKAVEVMETNWRHEVNNKAKLWTFKLFKNILNVEVECYTRFMYDRQSRSPLAQVRCGILPLNIESGRFSRLVVIDYY